MAVIDYCEGRESAFNEILTLLCMVYAKEPPVVAQLNIIKSSRRTDYT